MEIKLRRSKEPESIKIEGGLLSNVTGKIILKTPFGTREIASDGSLKGGRVKVESEPVIVEPKAKTSTSKPTSKSKKGKE